MIRAQGLSKAFGKIQAVDNLSFDAVDGKITALLGPNGAGKSTTLRMLYTVLKPDAGQALIDGADIQADLLAARRKLGVLPHSAGLYPHLTALENIRYYGRLSGLENAELEQRVSELSAVLDLGPIADRHAKGFSQGERTRVALARALVHRPKNLLLDEPTNGLDVMATRSLRKLLLQLKDQGHCILLSSHIMQEVAALADQIVIIAHGRVVADGTPEQILTRTGADDLESAFVDLIGAEDAG
ncbi:MAG: ATP-binding cassette domain-containing protein [Gammaproteobacteria bacterium]|nr:ATP-binding cassette domain-containing protein [Gammaproteobacteria bacterium]MCZ6687880.1 ATP-binding cassette domain-containing protein [Gammaproteobacteria bacterium]MCZ6762932.1 ATP-binding cassette domain-containing protein [Gammaproteobacteria bacterium]MCZ6879811.1 ATP-binding cassette domain-containing protein [Gammaproteobacteria bacterium]TDJ11063.1 MAG: ATP-binding cassette domain-containing protein [Gammaproteobacteria bacterium]